VPVTIRPEEGNSGGYSHVAELEGRDYHYEYPEDLDLKPMSELHTQLFKRVLDFARQSRNYMENRYSSWNYIDSTMTAYIPVSDYEDLIKKRHKKNETFHPDNKPTSIVVPHSYATEDTLLTYMTQALLDGPIIQYEGVGPEDEVPAQLLQLAVDYQIRRRKAALDLYAAFKDMMRYGICATTFNWEVHEGHKVVVREEPNLSLWGQNMGTTKYKENVPTVLYEGNVLSNIDPYRMLPDPNVSIHKQQSGEFFGWIEITDYNTMLSQERNGEFFNVKYLKHLEQPQSQFTEDKSKRELNDNKDNSGYKTDDMTNKHTLVNMFIHLVPKDWKLGKSTDPERWFFTVADDTVVVRAQPLGLNHNMFPIAVGASEFDGHTVTPISKMEVIHGLQSVLNWMMNSHVANVRKVINDMLIVDPSLVNMADLRDPDAGKLIRMRRRAFGRPVTDAIHQLNVQDITQNNVQDSLYLADLIQRTSAATDSMQGIMRSGGERRSATEFRGTASGALSRLERMAWVMGVMYMHDVGYFYASHTQQLMEEEIFVRIAGDWPEDLRKIHGPSVKISPFDILVDYDVIIRDGTSDLKGAAMADVWVQIFQAISANPAIAEITGLDVGRIFMHIAKLTGAKNVFDFVKQGGGVQTQTQPDEQVLQQAQQGNLIPLQTAQGA